MVAESIDAARTLGERLRDVAFIQQALARGVRDALLRHKQAGNPVAVWRDGRVMWVEADDIPVAAGER